jgi:hypothetical protein
VTSSVDPGPQTLDIDIACVQLITTDVSILPFTLMVDPGPMSAGAPFTAALDGDGQFSEDFMDVAQTVVKCGVRSGKVIELAATVALRTSDGATGATGPDVTLLAYFTQLENRCSLTGAVCTPAGGPGDCAQFPSITNNCVRGWATVPTLDGIPTGNRCNAGAPNAFTSCSADTDCPPDCIPGDQDNPCFACDVPGCEPGPAPACGTDNSCNCDGCAAVDLPSCTPGVNCIKEAQCETNGFCVTAGLPIPIASNTGSYIAGASGADFLYGWFDGDPPTTNPNGTTVLPPANKVTVPPLGMDVEAGSGLNVGLRCLMSVDSGGVNGVSKCEDGPNATDDCLSRADLVGTPGGDNFCASGDNVGLPCDPIAASTEPDPCPNALCIGFNCACENNDCGLLVDGVTAANCAGTDTGSPTPDTLLIPYVVP